MAQNCPALAWANNSLLIMLNLHILYLIEIFDMTHLFLPLELKDIDAKKLAELREKAESGQLAEEEKPFSPYNLQTVFWILATFAIFYYTDFIPVIKVDPRVNR